MDKSQLVEAKENLARIREQYKDEHFLLSLYEPSAILLVNLLEGENN